MSKAILRLPQVIKRTGLARSTIYLQVEQDNFPKPMSIGERSIGWLESDIEAWIDERKEQGWTKSPSPKLMLRS